MLLQETALFFFFVLTCYLKLFDHFTCANLPACMCFHGHVCIFVCGSSSSVGLWEHSVLLSHNMRPMRPRCDVRTEVRASAPLRGRRFTSCLSGPRWAESRVEQQTVCVISPLFDPSVSVSCRLCGWCCNRRSQRISSSLQERCTVWGSLWRRLSNTWERLLCEWTHKHRTRQFEWCPRWRRCLREFDMCCFLTATLTITDLNTKTNFVPLVLENVDFVLKTNVFFLST